MNQGSISQADRANAVGHTPSYLPEANPGMHGGNTYTGTSSDPTIQDYENIFGPSARDIKTDLQRFKRHGRWHLPDVLRGPNPWLTDRIDGLITDATNSPFTTKILPYMYKEDVDGKMKWNVWSFDEGMASRVPYESAARTLQQSKRSFSAYMVRHGMAIVLEHNFMMSPKGRENFKNQLNQLVGSIQYSNDFDVHMALVLAPSYQKTMREQYYTVDKTAGQICREFCDLFGMMQKNQNALDILIEEAKAILKTWGGPMPDFILCNSKLTFQLTMTPEKTNYITQGADGQKRLRQGPDLGSYRGLSVIHSRAFSLEKGQHPRDILRRRVRVAEYYRILPHKDNWCREFELYNEARDTWFTLTFEDLCQFARVDPPPPSTGGATSSCFGEFGDSGPFSHSLGTLLSMSKDDTDMVNDMVIALKDHPLGMQLTQMPQNPDFTSVVAVDQTDKQEISWGVDAFAFSLGMECEISESLPHKVQVLNKVGPHLRRECGGDKLDQTNCVIPYPRFPRSSCGTFLGLVIQEKLEIRAPFQPGIKGIRLEHPSEVTDADMFGHFLFAFGFYREVYTRCGISMNRVEKIDVPVPVANFVPSPYLENDIVMTALTKAALKKNVTNKDLDNFFLGNRDLRGSMNHVLNMGISQVISDDDYRAFVGNSLAKKMGRSVIITQELLFALWKTSNKADGTSNHVAHWIHIQPPTLGSDEANMFISSYKAAIEAQSAVHLTSLITSSLVALCDARGVAFKDEAEKRALGMTLLTIGMTSFPMDFTSLSHLLHPENPCLADGTKKSVRSYVQDNGWGSMGQLPLGFVKMLAQETHQINTHHFCQTLPLPRELMDSDTLDVENDQGVFERCWKAFWEEIFARMISDPKTNIMRLRNNRPWQGITSSQTSQQAFMFNPKTREQLVAYETKIRPLRIPDHESIWKSPVVSNNPVSLRIVWTDTTCEVVMDKGGSAAPSHPQPGSGSGAGPSAHIPPPPPAPGGGGGSSAGTSSDLEDYASKTEFVIIRPNIEHNMLGVILGLGGNELGQTLWGQTELSCYDDAMHGIWGMSYKYHERAIVFNEKNLVRLWDIAYDGYNGGKDDTYVDWVEANAPNGYVQFANHTMDLGQSYHGPSMMVMQFMHTQGDRNTHNFQRNWPSPIVFHDFPEGANPADPRALPLDFENLQVMDVRDFQVFRTQLYEHRYKKYRDKMPNFHELHKMRKTAGQATAEAETQTDSLAFQGSMRIKHNGRIIQEIQGSGHHGPDYVGVASVRAGKGIKYTGQAPILSHTV